MKNLFPFLILAVSLMTCSEDNDDNLNPEISTTFTFTHNWDGAIVSNTNFNAIQYTNANGELLSIERLRYVISDIKFTSNNNEMTELDVYNLVDVTNANNLSFTPETTIPAGSYTVSFTFGLDNEDNSENYLDLNSESFNVPDMLGGGYHYMQFDGKFINSSATEQGFNYHAIRATDNPGMNPTFPQDTFFTVNLGIIEITNDINIEIEMNIAEWFKNPNLWDLNVLNQMLMPNSLAQIMMYENGQNVFSLGDVIQ
ncbi:MbnP family protein [Winogradskyella sp.]|uniref:MbnP family protein n=1 Tax=Winogradskyella sp. TaxID=1883156 RepID=UPI0025FC759D|nr:MbnP family protein [Winogradskyella sp.]